MIFIKEKQENYENKRLQITRYYAVNYPFYTMDYHLHDEWEIMYAAYGRCKVFCIEKEAEKEYDLREGEYILLGAGVMHKLVVEKETPCRVLNLEGNCLDEQKVPSLHTLFQEEGMQSFLEQESVVLIGRDDGRLHETLSELIRELKHTKSGKRTSLLADFLLGQMMIHLKRQWTEQEKREGNSSFYIGPVQEYLEENFDREITVAEIAGAVKLSEGYLQRLYKKEKKMTIMDKVLQLRIEKAKLLLENSTLPVIDVAIAAGFNSRQHFSATFTKMAGCSPASWRKSKGNVHVIGQLGSKIDN